MWLKYYSVENLYEIQLDDLSNLKLNDSSILEKRILKKSARILSSSSKKKIHNKILVLDKSFDNFNIFKYQNKKILIYRKILQVIKNKNISFFLLNNYLNPSNSWYLGNTGVRNLKTAAGLRSFLPILNLSFPKNLKKVFPFSESEVNKVFNGQILGQKKQHFKNNFLNGFLSHSNVLTGGSSIKQKKSFFWSTNSLLYKGSFIKFSSRKQKNRSNNFILI